MLRVVFEFGFEVVSQRDPVAARKRDLRLQTGPAMMNGIAMHARGAETARW
jgi:hypothetical protein